MSTEATMIEVSEIEDALADTLGEKKAGDLLEDAMADVGVDGPQLEEETAMELLDAITEMDDVSSLANVAANTTKTQLRR